LKRRLLSYYMETAGRGKLTTSWQDWKSAQYRSNSGIRNSLLFPHPSGPAAHPSASLPFITSRSSSDLAAPAKPIKTFTVSYESASYNPPCLPRVTMMNHQNTHYDPITHVEVHRSTNFTANRLRSISHFADQTRNFVSNSIEKYKETVQQQPKAFNRRSGQFTRYSELCLMSSKPAFVQPFAFTTRATPRVG